MYQEFERLNRMIPADVSREAAESAMSAGEIEGAISALIEEAFDAGELSAEALDFAISLGLTSGFGDLVQIIAENFDQK